MQDTIEKPGQAAGEAIDKMLTQDIFGAQQPLRYVSSRAVKTTLNRVLSRLAELFFVLDEEGGIVSQQRAAAFLGVPPGCGEAAGNRGGSAQLCRGS